MSYSKIIYTGDFLELYTYERSPKIQLRRKQRLPKEADSKRSDVNYERRPDNIRRLRKHFVRLVRSNLASNGNPAFVTLTMLDVVGLETGAKLYNSFIKKARAVFGDDIRVIGVPEFQKRGAVHYHALVWGIPERIIEHEAPHWHGEADFGLLGKVERGSRYIQSLWAYGYVDCVLTDGSPKLANYVAKYMYKAMQDSRLYGRRAYYATRNVLRPMLVTTSAPHHFIKALHTGDNVLIESREFDTVWLGRCEYQLIQQVPHESLSN